MIRFFVFVFITLAVYRDGCFGNQAITGLEDLSDDNYPDSEIPVKRNSYQLDRSADALNMAVHPNICYFIHEGHSESQISCRLRFARSKFNFNPFGLRFGKRAHSNTITKREPVSARGWFLPYLLKLQDGLTPPCEEASGERC